MREILLEHESRYPQMEIADAVKLLYQSEFGGGHMIDCPEASLVRLQQEYESHFNSLKSTEGENTPIWERIGGGLYRLDLRMIKQGLSVQTLNRMFVCTANQTRGSISGLEEKLEELRRCCIAGEVPFALPELDQYLKRYREQGYPAVSHSTCYRETYRPSYRVVSECYLPYAAIFLQIDGLLQDSEKSTLRIAVDGRSGSGKSTLGQMLQELYGCNLFHMDDFFLRPEQRTEARFAQPGGNVDYERFETEVLRHLADPSGMTYQVYDCRRQLLGEKRTLPHRRLNLIEGVYSQHPYFGDIYDLRIFLKVEPEEQVRRILERNGAQMLERFQKEWIPLENTYFETYPIENESIQVD
ncbi:MAG: shikimate kinase [Hungatella sp.]